MPSPEANPSIKPLIAEAASSKPLVVILGPTAAGKTEISLQLAERLAGEIVSADSRLFYRGMDIGTAKPSAQERARAPHHLIDIAEPDETWSLGMFQERAHQVIQEIHLRQNLPFLVGGTGQYVHAVIRGWQIPRVQPNPRLRQALADWASQIGQDELHNRLAELDPKAATQIDPRNLRRVIRAFEVIFSTGQRFSEQRQQGASPYHCLQIGLNRPRSILYARIDQRVEQMISNGLVGEVRDLLERGYSPDLPSLSAIGYREIIAYLQGQLTLEDAIIQIKRATHTFVRRQANWFKPGDPHIHWFNLEQTTLSELEDLIYKFLEDTLGSNL